MTREQKARDLVVEALRNEFYKCYFLTLYLKFQTHQYQFWWIVEIVELGKSLPSQAQPLHDVDSLDLVSRSNGDPCC